MPTLLTSGVVADEYGLNPKLSNLIIGIGIIIIITGIILICVIIIITRRRQAR